MSVVLFLCVKVKEDKLPTFNCNTYRCIFIDDNHETYLIVHVHFCVLLLLVDWALIIEKPDVISTEVYRRPLRSSIAVKERSFRLRDLTLDFFLRRNHLFIGLVTFVIGFITKIDHLSVLEFIGTLLLIAFNRWFHRREVFKVKSWLT